MTLSVILHCPQLQRTIGRLPYNWWPFNISNNLSTNLSAGVLSNWHFSPYHIPHLFKVYSTVVLIIITLFPIFVYYLHFPLWHYLQQTDSTALLQWRPLRLVHQGQLLCREGKLLAYDMGLWDTHSYAFGKFSSWSPSGVEVSQVCRRLDWHRDVDILFILINITRKTTRLHTGR